MSIKPFLSHKREDADDVDRLRDMLCIYGAGGWKDTEDLQLGVLADDAIRRAIAIETGGFIWWGTRQVLDSRPVNEIELPSAFLRKCNEPAYPLVPLFIELNPAREDDNKLMKGSLGPENQKLLECNGLVKRVDESLSVFQDRSARRYVFDAVKSLANSARSPEAVSVAIRIQSEPSGEHDLTIDWRALFERTTSSLLGPGLTQIESALAVVRDALRGAFDTPRVILDSDLPLPLAFMVGYEWRITTHLSLVVRQRYGSRYSLVAGEGAVQKGNSRNRQVLSGRGPTVVAVSCGGGLGEAPDIYAAQVGARELITVHVPGELDDDQIRALARACAGELRDINNRGFEKHLLMLGPESLAVLAGTASNACGPVMLPFWNGSRYVNPLVVGG